LTRRRASLLIVQSLIGLGLLAVWALAVDLSDVWQTLAQARWPIVIAAAMISVCSSFVRAARWRLILRPVARVPLWEIWLITLVSSLVNFVIPVRSGELARAVLLKQRRRVPMSASLPTVAIDRSFDLLAVLLLGALGAAIGIRLDPRRTVVFTCGPEIMMRFVIYEALARRLPKEGVYLSMERNMKCAVGFCGHCQFGPTFLCRQGPVLNFAAIEPFFGREDF